jgi:hypothetical protein
VVDFESLAVEEVASKRGIDAALQTSRPVYLQNHIDYQPPHYLFNLK